MASRPHNVTSHSNDPVCCDFHNGVLFASVNNETSGELTFR